MRNEYNLFTFAHLQLSYVPSTVIGSVILWGILTVVAVMFLHFSVAGAFLLALIAVALHWLSDFFHQLGHAWAALRTSYPMTGVQFWGLLSRAIYPQDEPELPAEIHIRRALGGPMFSALLTLFAGILLFTLRNLGGAAFWLALFLFLDNLLVFTIGAFIPLGFNDGSTLLYWRGKRGR